MGARPLQERFRRVHYKLTRIVKLLAPGLRGRELLFVLQKCRDLTTNYLRRQSESPSDFAIRHFPREPFNQNAVEFVHCNCAFGSIRECRDEAMLLESIFDEREARRLALLEDDGRNRTDG